VVVLEGSVGVFGRRLKKSVIGGFAKGGGGGGGGVDGAYEGVGGGVGVGGTCSGGGVGGTCIGGVMEIGGRHKKDVDSMGEDESCVEGL
jgi:hypothetical protein